MTGGWKVVKETISIGTVGYQCYLGATIQRGPCTGGKKLKKGVFAAPKATRKILSTFWDILAAFVDKNAIKSDFWGCVGTYISIIYKNTHVWGKNTSVVKGFVIQNLLIQNVPVSS